MATPLRRCRKFRATRSRVEQHAGAALDLGNHFAFGAGIAVALAKNRLLVKLAQQIEAGDHEGLTRQEAPARRLRLGDAGFGREVAGADVFFERQAHDFDHRASSILRSWAS